MRVSGVFSMEAVALYTFRATEGDELSFNKGDILKVRAGSRTFSSEESPEHESLNRSQGCRFPVEARFLTPPFSVPTRRISIFLITSTVSGWR